MTTRKIMRFSRECPQMSPRFPSVQSGESLQRRPEEGESLQTRGLRAGPRKPRTSWPAFSAWSVFLDVYFWMSGGGGESCGGHAAERSAWIAGTLWGAAVSAHERPHRARMRDQHEPVRARQPCRVRESESARGVAAQGCADRPLSRDGTPPGQRRPRCLSFSP